MMKLFYLQLTIFPLSSYTVIFPRDIQGRLFSLLCVFTIVNPKTKTNKSITNLSACIFFLNILFVSISSSLNYHSKCKARLREYSNYGRFTGGTKTMSVGLAIAGLDYQVTLYFTVGNCINTIDNRTRRTHRTSRHYPCPYYSPAHFRTPTF